MKIDAVKSRTNKSENLTFFSKKKDKKNLFACVTFIQAQ